MKQRKPFGHYLTRVGQRRRPFTDSYAFLLRARWPVVVGLAATIFVAVNAGFGLLYSLAPGSVANCDGSFLESFFFSVQTFAAIGYGFMYAQGLWGNLICTLEAFVSLFFIAVLTGIVFAKFARPHARVLFSAPLVIEIRDGHPTLSFRVANERGNDVVEAAIRVAVLKTVKTAEGRTMRRFFDLELDRSSTPVFLLSWQIFHRIDESSPIYGLSKQDMAEDDVRFTVALTGLDGTFSQTIHARHMYWGEDIEWGHRFVDVIEPMEGGVVRMHFERFHSIEPESTRPADEPRRGS